MRKPRRVPIVSQQTLLSAVNILSPDDRWRATCGAPLSSFHHNKRSHLRKSFHADKTRPQFPRELPVQSRQLPRTPILTLQVSFTSRSDLQDQSHQSPPGPRDNSISLTRELRGLKAPRHHKNSINLGRSSTAAPPPSSWWFALAFQHGRSPPRQKKISTVFSTVLFTTCACVTNNTCSTGALTALSMHSVPSSAFSKTFVCGISSVVVPQASWIAGISTFLPRTAPHEQHGPKTPALQQPLEHRSARVAASLANSLTCRDSTLATVTGLPLFHSQNGLTHRRNKGEHTHKREFSICAPYLCEVEYGTEEARVECVLKVLSVMNERKMLW